MAEASRRKFDWEAAKRKLVPATTQDPEEDLTDVFRERAAALARRPATAGHAAETPHMAFRVADVRFAVAVAEVRTCLSPSWVTRIPCAPVHLADVIHVEGRIVSVLDLGALFGLGTAPKTQERHARVILIEASGKTLGLWATEIDGIVGLDPASLDTTRAQGSRGAEFLRGITANMTLVLAPSELVQRAKNGAAEVAR